MMERTFHPRATTVLLVEFDPADADRIMTALQSADTYPFSIKWVTRLDEAIEAVKNQSFDIILLELILPDSQGLDGFDKMVDAAPDALILVLSASPNDELALQALQRGAQET